MALVGKAVIGFVADDDVIEDRDTDELADFAESLGQ